jgi:hypothetical protein
MAPESERAQDNYTNDLDSLEIEMKDYAAPEPTPTCSEVVERLANECMPPIGIRGNISAFDREQAEAILHSWRERRVQELEKALELCMSVIWSEFHTGPTDDMAGDNEADIAYRAGKKALEWREQIRKGAKHER